jgi:hypothetical protein
MGEVLHEVVPGDTVEIVLRNSGGRLLAARCESDVPWLEVDRTRIRLDGGDSTILTVRVKAEALKATTPRGLVRIRASAQDARIGFHLLRRRWELWRWAVAILAGVVPVLVTAAVVVTYETRAREEVVLEPLSGVLVVPELPEDAVDTKVRDRPVATPAPGTLRVRVNPTSEAILVNGVVVGSGEVLGLSRPPRGSIRLITRHHNFVTDVRDVEVSDDGLDITVNLQLERRLSFRPTPDLTRGAVATRGDEDAIDTRSDSIDACLRAGSEAGEFYTGTLLVHVDPQGRAVGMELHGDRADEPAVHACVERQAATFVVGELQEGDFATVRYDYTVSAGDLTP